MRQKEIKRRNEIKCHSKKLILASKIWSCYQVCPVAGHYCMVWAPGPETGQFEIITFRGVESIANRAHHQINIACRGSSLQDIALFYLKVNAILYSILRKQPPY